MIERSFRELVESTAARTPSPAGGAAAALTATLGGALLLMAVRFSRGKKKTASRDDELAEVEERLQAQVDRLQSMAERDCAAFEAVAEAYKLPQQTDAQKQLRVRAVDEAMLGAMTVPEEMMCLVRDALATIVPVVDCIATSVLSDMGVGAELLRAAAVGAMLNVRTNAGFLSDRGIADIARQRTKAIRDEIREHYTTIHAGVEAQF